MTMDVSLVGFDAFDKRLAAVPQVAARELRTTMTASLLLIEADARQHVSQDTRRLAGSIHHTITGTGLALEGAVGPSLRYGVVVERGRRPGAKMPPVAALIPWVRRHRLAGVYSPSTKRRRGSKVTQAQQDFRVALNIARAIGRRGIKARPFLVPAYKRNLPEIRRRFAVFGARVLGTLRGGS